MKNPKAREKRRHAKLARQKATRADRVASFRQEQARQTLYQARLREARAMTKGAQSFPTLSDEDYTFWLCHGANYLASDSATGVWSPIFEDIYSGKVPAPEALAQQVMLTYQTQLEAEERLSGVPRAVLAWTMTDRAIVSIYKYEAVRRLKEANPECDAESLARAPHNPTVWSLMDTVRARTLAAGDAMDANPSQTE